MTDQVLLAARGLNRFYGSHQALHDVEFSLRRGEILGFLGLNGAGKSTTMQILAGALRPHGGRVEVCGRSIEAEPLRAKKALGYLPEIPPLHRDLAVDEYLGFSARLRRMPGGAVAGAVLRARALCGLEDVGNRMIGHLSRGYQQRIGIAQAIVHDPSVLILDEPTSGLDPLQIRGMRALIRGLARERAVIVSTHILPEVRIVATRIMILHYGRVVHDASVDAGRQHVRARFRNDPGSDRLLSISGVTRAEATDHGGWDLEVDDCEETAARLAARAVEEAWGLVELQPDFDALEHLFMRLTAGGEPPQAPA